MIKINNHTIDLVLQVEEHTNIQKIFNLLTLDINDILIICPELFLQRFIQHEDFDERVVNDIEKNLITSHIELHTTYKNKHFNFHFIITSSESKTINNPFKGEQTFKVGIKEIKI